MLGILEDVPGDNPESPHSRGVRVVFEKQGDRWRAFPSSSPEEGYLKTLPSQYPREMTWTISFDGRSLGRLTARTPAEFPFYSEVGLQEITSAGVVPIVGKRSAEYGGSLDALVYRPLVAISKPYFKDPDGRKPLASTSLELLKRLRLAFRVKFPKLCMASKRDPSRLEPFLYRDEDIRVAKAYSSRDGRSIARLHLEGAIDCEDVEAGFDIDDPWFLVNPDASAHYLDSGMWLVDAGDYDNDGESELVFSIDRENRGGYELFYNRFRKHEVFEFLYH